MRSAAAGALGAHAAVGAGAAENTSSQTPAVEEDDDADQPETGRGGIGSGENAGAAQGSEVVELVSAQPEKELEGTPQSEADTVEEEAFGVSPQLNEAGRGGRGGLSVVDAAGASEIKSPQPEDKAEVAATESPQPSEAGRGGGSGFAVTTGICVVAAAQGSEESDNKSPQPLEAVEAGVAASPHPPEAEIGTENVVDPQSEDTGREEDEVSASMSSMLTFGLGTNGTGGNAFLDGFAPAGGGGGAATTGGTGSGGRTRGWFVFSGSEGKRPAARSAAIACRSSART